MSVSRTPLYLTYALMLFGFASISSARVAVSLYALELGAAPSTVGLLIGTLYILPLLISWPIGRYADRLGSRWLLLAGAISGACAMLIPFFVRELPALYLTTTMLGLSFTLYNVLLPNLVGVLSDASDRARNFSNSSLIGSTTLFIGPLLAGVAVDFLGHAYAFLVLLALPAGVIASLAFWGASLPGGSRSPGAAGGLRETVSDPAMLRILATSSLVQVGQDLYQFYIPVYGHGIGISASAIGGLLATFAAASFVVRFFLPAVIARFGEEKVLAISFVVSGSGFALVPFFQNVAVLGAVTFVFGLGMGCGQPITTMLIFGRTPRGRSGEILGLRQSFNNGVRVIGPAAFGFVASVFGLPAVFWLSALMMGGGGLLARPGKGGTDEAAQIERLK